MSRTLDAEEKSKLMRFRIRLATHQCVPFPVRSIHSDTILRECAFGPAAHAAGYALIVALRVSVGTK